MHYPVSFILLNLQNDLCHPEGVYARNGLLAKSIDQIVPNITKTVEFCHENKIPTIATHLTVLTDLEEHPQGLGSVRKLRPFLEKEGFRRNTWGHDLLEEIPKIDYQISQWSMSPFYQTELDRYILSFGIETLVLCGFPANGSVETCAREAIGRSLRVITLTDCVASYSESLHKASLTNLSAFGHIMTSDEWMQTISKTEAKEE